MHAGDGFRARGVVGDESEIAEAEVLAEAFVVDEEKGFVFYDRAAGGCAEDVAFEMRDVAVIEEVASVERAVAHEFVGGAVELVGSVGGDDVDLRAGTLAVFGAVGVFDDGKFADGVDAEQLTAEAAGRVVDFGGAGEFDAVEEKEILLRAAAGDREHVADDGVRCADATGALRGVVDDAGIEREELIVAAAVERQVFDLALADQAGDIFGGDLDDAGVGRNFDGLMNVADLEREIDFVALADGEGDAGPLIDLEAGF